MTSRVGRRLHLTLLTLWIVPGLPISIWLRDSVPWVVGMSWYAIVAAHWSGWSAERPTEVIHE